MAQRGRDPRGSNPTPSLSQQISSAIERSIANIPEEMRPSFSTFANSIAAVLVQHAESLVPAAPPHNSPSNSSDTVDSFGFSSQVNSTVYSGIVIISFSEKDAAERVAMMESTLCGSTKFKLIVKNHRIVPTTQEEFDKLDTTQQQRLLAEEGHLYQYLLLTIGTATRETTIKPAYYTISPFAADPFRGTKAWAALEAKYAPKDGTLIYRKFFIFLHTRMGSSDTLSDHITTLERRYHELIAIEPRAELYESLRSLHLFASVPQELYGPHIETVMATKSANNPELPWQATVEGLISYNNRHGLDTLKSSKKADKSESTLSQSLAMVAMTPYRSKKLGKRVTYASSPTTSDSEDEGTRDRANDAGPSKKSFIFYFNCAKPNHTNQVCRQKPVTCD